MIGGVEYRTIFKRHQTERATARWLDDRHAGHTSTFALNPRQRPALSRRRGVASGRRPPTAPAETQRT